MLNVLKVASIYTGAYFLFCIAYMLVLVAVQIFWKPVVLFFFVVLALLGYDYFRNGAESAASSFFVDWKGAFTK